MKRFSRRNVFTDQMSLGHTNNLNPECMNKNILQAYHNNLLDDFMLEREKGTESPKGKLDEDDWFGVRENADRYDDQQQIW